MIAHAREVRPNECCGLLIGTPVRIERIHRARNLERGSARFLIDPRDHFAAIREARDSGRFVVGVYHSHPRGGATPSPSDLAEASYDDYLYLIVGLVSEPFEVKLFRLEDGVFVEEPVIKVKS